MKKNGFTLVEVIISLGLIAVIAAISAPLINNLLPDRNKLAVLKVNRLLTDTTNYLLDNPGFYLKVDDCVGLDCFDPPTAEFPYFNSGIPTYGQLITQNLRNNKYRVLLATHLVSNVNDLGRLNAFNEFRTADNVIWQVSNYDQQTQTFAVNINTQPDNPNSCFFINNNCQPRNIGRFRFTVNRRGIVAPVDPLSEVYLSNPYKLNNRNADIAAARRKF